MEGRGRPPGCPKEEGAVGQGRPPYQILFATAPTFNHTLFGDRTMATRSGRMILLGSPQ